MSAEFSPKQLHSIFEATARHNYWIGSVSAGKTVAAIHAYMKFNQEAGHGEFMILGKSQGSIKRNIIPEITNFLGMRARHFEGKQVLYIGDRKHHVLGAYNERVTQVIQGSSLVGALIDEGTTIPQPVFQMLLSRLRKQGARLFLTSNPDSPYHWLKTEYIDRQAELDMKIFEFSIDDNPFLEAAYVEQIKREYRGLWYKRFIEGKWVLAEGAIYDFFDQDEHTIEEVIGLADEYIVGVDYGTVNPCVFNLIGFSHQTFPNKWLEKEYYYNSQVSMRQKGDTEYVEDLIKFIEGYPVTAIYVDPSAASFKAEMRKQGLCNVYDANNDVINGIRFMTDLLMNGTYKIMRNCKNAVAEYSNYVWDMTAAKKGIDKPLKQNDHSMDAQRYALYTHFFNKPYQRLKPQDIDRMWKESQSPDQDLPPFFRGNPYF